MAGSDDDRRLPSVPLRPVAQRQVMKLMRARTRRPLNAAQALATLRARVQRDMFRPGARG
jgi:hypothetical protein